MKFFALLGLLFQVVSATNATAGNTTGSSSSATGSSSSDTTTTAGSSSSAAGTTNTTTTTVTSSSTTTTSTTNNNGTTSTATTTTATTTMTTVDANATTTAAPAELVQVTASYEAVEQLPSNITAAQLMTSTAYKGAKKAGLVAALSTTADAVTVTGFTIVTGNAGRRMLAVGSVTVKTDFSVAVADATAATAMSTSITGAAAAIKTQTDAAMAAADWTGDAAISTAPTMATPTVATPVVVTVTNILTGTSTTKKYTDATCTTLKTGGVDVVNTIGSCNTNGADSLEVLSCGTHLVYNAHTASTTCAATGGNKVAGATPVGVCLPTATAGEFEKHSCAAATTPAATTATSSAFGNGISAAALLIAGVTLF